MSIQIIIPKTDLEILKIFEGIPKDIKEKILDGFENLPPEDPHKYIEELSKKLEFDIDVLTNFFSFCIRYYYNFYLIGKSTEEFIDIINKSAKLHKFELDITDELKDSLLKILNMEKSLGIIAKTLALLKDNPINYLNARIVTDLRHIYYTNIPEITDYALVIHTLKFNLLKENKPKTIYITLKSSDLVSLRDTISRALVKDNNLSKTCFDKEIKLIKDIDIYEGI